MVGENKVAKDFYRVLRVSRTATTAEIKQAYRRLALELHPDRNDGCEIKSAHFKDATEAYGTLSDSSKRRVYDHEINGNRSHAHPYQKRTVYQGPTPQYRKVYAPRPPPGFKIFDFERHNYMHYGDGIMNEEIERMKARAAKAGGRDEYKSQLGPGFKLGKINGSTGGGQWVKGGRKKDAKGAEYDYAYYVEGDETEMAKRKLSVKEEIRERMKQRRNERIRSNTSRSGRVSTEPKGFQGRDFAKEAQRDDGCVIM